MGRVTGASICYGAGETEEIADWRAGAPRAGQVELQYDYGPALVPGGEMTGGMWRFRDLLPIGDGPILYPLAVGETPLVAPPALRRAVGLPGLYLKDETRGPSGSNKDRATALVLESALRQGIGTVTCASTGNVATSLAIGAAAAGLRAALFVPEDVSPGKLRVMLLAGALVLKVKEGYEAAFALSREAAQAFSWLDRNTGVNPATLEAKKTVALEIWQQLGRRMPDAVLAPVGDGVTLAALAKGFREITLCSLADRIPRIVGVQSERCQPIRTALERGTAVEPVESRTLAEGIAVGNPVCAPSVLRDARESGGGIVAVPDEALVEAIGTLARDAGVVAEPAGAAALAGLGEARRLGLVGAQDTVVLLVTGTGLKTPEFLQTAEEPRLIHATLDEVERQLG